MSESIQAFDGKIIVEPDSNHTDRVEGGIVIPRNADPHGGDMETGTIVSCGRRVDGVRTFDTPHEPDVPFAPGTRVLFSKFSGTNVRLGDRKLVAMQISDILAVYLPDDATLDEVKCPFCDTITTRRWVTQLQK